MPSMQIFGTCGQTIKIPVNGVLVSFTCVPTEPATPDDPEGAVPPDPEVSPVDPVLLGPIELDPGGVAYATVDTVTINPRVLHRELFTQPDEVVAGARPVVITIPTGVALDMAEVVDRLQAARAERRPVRFQVEAVTDRLEGR